MIDDWHKCNELCQGDAHFDTSYTKARSRDKLVFHKKFYEELGADVIHNAFIECGLPGDGAERELYGLLCGEPQPLEPDDIPIGTWFREKRQKVEL